MWRAGAVTAETLLPGATGITFEKLSIRPVVGVSGVYDSNIFLDSDNEVSDYLLQVFPGIALAYDMGARGEMSLGYAGDFAYYSDRSDQNWQSNSGFFNLNYQAPGGPILGISQRYTESDDPYGNEEEYGLGETRKRRTNTLGVRFGWRLLRDLRPMVYFNHSQQKYEVVDELDAAQNSTTVDLGLGVEKKVLTRTRVLIGYYNGHQTYDDHRGPVTSDNDASNRRHRLDVGLRWEGTGRLTGSVNVGYQWLRYDNERDAAGNPYDDEQTWVANAAVGWAISAASQLNVNLSRSSRPQSGFTVQTLGTTTVGVSLAQALPHRLRGVVGFAYSLSEEDSGGNDHSYNANLSVSYPFRSWLDGALGYRYLKRDADEAGGSFDGHQFTVTLAARF